MSREKMITREVKIFSWNVMYCDTINATVATTTIETYVNDEKVARKAFEAEKTSESYVPVSFTMTSCDSAIYGMTETEFMKYAKKIKESR